ncbi:MAG: hypothetical protein A2854_03020 [Parcubacteria group bacterium RIFCSPHIGHO2_01_FULL_56_18]|nr:MAG: hypothetical protein A2854_03020 [Parcubacteria group bacterium RIFCSPHIGHO2_01_FULL_56_18]
MANTSSAKKAYRVELRRRVFNARRAKTLKDSVKELMKSKDVKVLSKAQQAIDKAAKRGLIKKNTASRMKARLARQVATK